jgi:hypothetical protein
MGISLKHPCHLVIRLIEKLLVVPYCLLNKIQISKPGFKTPPKSGASPLFHASLPALPF